VKHKLSRESAAALAALAVYTVFNFWYLPLGITFPDENRFIQEAITLRETGEFRVGV
jgi:hypothetical protein